MLKQKDYEPSRLVGGRGLQTHALLKLGFMTLHRIKYSSFGNLQDSQTGLSGDLLTALSDRT